MCSKYSWRFKSERFQHDYRYKWIKKNKQESIFHVNVNVNLMEQKVSEVNGGITINVHVSVKNIIYVKKILSGIQLHAIVKNENILQVLWMIQWLLVVQL